MNSDTTSHKTEQDESDVEDGEVSEEEYEELDIDPEDHATLDALNKPEVAGRTLADVIFSKMEGGAVSQGLED